MKIIANNQAIEVDKIEFDFNKDGSYDIWYYDEYGTIYHDSIIEEQEDCPYILKKI